jgi:predicted phosphodiesterase
LKYLIFSDLHANSFGLNKVLDYVSDHDIDRVFSLGDNVGYNSYPNECIDLIQKQNIESIKGNHECLVLNEISATTCKSERGQNTAFVTRNLLTESNRSFLKNLPFEKSINSDSIFIHAGFSSVYETVNTPQKAKINFGALKEKKKKIAFFGHTHRPGIYVYSNENETVETLPIDAELFIEKDKSYMINPGSCGEVRHGLPLSFVIYDDKKNTVRFELFNLSEKQIQIVNMNNKKVFGTTSFKRMPKQLKEKSKKIYYKIGKIKDGLLHC